MNIMFSLEVLTSTAYPLEVSLEVSSSVLSNFCLKRSLERIRIAIIRGEKLSSAFENEIVFPERIHQWISIGEASGDISRVFGQLRMYFQGELDRLTARIMLMIEPVLIVIVGFMLILFILQFIVPLFNVFGAVI
jgi:type II secretory pathway component PulF